jgi:hypothetical protein
MEKLISKLKTRKLELQTLIDEKEAILKQENIGCVNYIDAEKELNFYLGCMLMVKDILKEEPEVKPCKHCGNKVKYNYSNKSKSSNFFCTACDRMNVYYHVELETAIKQWNKEQENE